ncbi:sensor histidine kinase [Paenibacillus sp. HJL G12]|uniref:histidine kinase n=2 Tax=Paenibacillus dendrobii TaxID=2691084 RepID=A0A7X3LFT9_9BACL|nr:sensor histidine kinase [Paenibacillus dendrobii]
MVHMGKWNTLRNQILLGFMLVMCIILALVGIIMFDRVSVLLRNNAEKHVQQTAVQAAGQLDALLKQIDMLSTQVATDATIQTLLGKEVQGERVNFGMRQSLQQEVRKYEAYTTGIRSLELYMTDDRSLVPLSDLNLTDRVSDTSIRKADQAKGKLVWLGLDPRDADTVTAIRQVRLMDQSFAHGGYVLVRIDKSYFALTDNDSVSKSGTRERMGLFDEEGRRIFSNFDRSIDSRQVLHHDGETIELGDEAYIAVESRSKTTGWALVILTPVDYTTEGISVLRTVIVVSGLAGALLFLILSFALSTMITRPILNLIKAMRGSRFGNLKHNAISSTTMELRELNNTYNQMVDSLNELIEVVYQKEIIQSRTELKALQAQINPHFLFNTLEAFYWALEDKGEEELAQIVVSMSGLFRYVINRSEEDEWVTIGDELDHAGRYLTIMKMRMLDRLSWSIDTQDERRAVPLPKLLIQPLVENAILHGVEQRSGKGMVMVQAEPSERVGYTRITVTDDGPGMSAQKLSSLYEAMKEGYMSSSKGKGVGIANVERRLRLTYGEETEGLVIRSREGKGTVISFEIPDNGKGKAQ